MCKGVLLNGNTRLSSRLQLHLVVDSIIDKMSAKRYRAEV